MYCAEVLQQLAFANVDVISKYFPVRRSNLDNEANEFMIANELQETQMLNVRISDVFGNQQQNMFSNVLGNAANQEFNKDALKQSLSMAR